MYYHWVLELAAFSPHLTSFILKSTVCLFVYDTGNGTQQAFYEDNEVGQLVMLYMNTTISLLIEYLIYLLAGTLRQYPSRL